MNVEKCTVNFCVFIWRLGGFKLFTGFWKADTGLFQLGISIPTRWWNSAATDCPADLISGELSKVHLATVKCTLFCAPLLTRHTNSVISLSDTSFIVWRSSVNGSFLSVVYFCLKTCFWGWISSQLSERAEVVGGGCHVSPPLAPRINLPIPSLSASRLLCMSCSPSTILYVYVYIFIYIYTHM